MENASRALIIAGGVLIFIMILTIGVILYARFSEQNATYKRIVEDIELQKYNSKFEIYIGRTDIIPEEVVTAIYQEQEYQGVTVNVKIGATTISKNNPEQIIQDYGTDTFSCNTYTYDSYGKITSITFTKN